MDNEGWKAKLKIPPKDKRIKTSVSDFTILIRNHIKIFCFKRTLFMTCDLIPNT